MSNTSKNNVGKHALSDAVAGTIASLVSMLLFYPVDVYKTNIQAGNNPMNQNKEQRKETKDTKKEEKDPMMKQCATTSLTAFNLSSFLLSLLSKKPSILFRGLSYKTMHTITSSFAYFFIYSYLRSLHQSRRSRQRLRQRREGNSNSMNGAESSITSQLVLTSIAAIFNQLLTLPLDVLASRRQTSSIRTCNKNEHEDRNGNGNVTDKNEFKHVSESDATVLMGQVWNDLQDEYDNKNNDNEACIMRKEKLIATVTTPTTTPKYKKYTKLWRGLWPSILLCANPSIHYTIFDVLKEKLILRKQKRGKQNFRKQQQAQEGLNMWEAFFIGLIAKFVATIVTYPLIRAKVMLMVSSSSSSSSAKSSLTSNNNNNDNDTFTTINNSNNPPNFNPNTNTNSNTNSNTNTNFNTNTNSNSNTNTNHDPTMKSVLQKMYHNGGISELYKGCGLQILLTVLKSALMMSMRERIGDVTRKIIVG